MFRRSRVLCYLLLAWSTVTPVLADPPLRMALDGGAVVVSELESGAEVVCFTFSRWARNFVPYNERNDELLVDDDGDGEVRIPLRDPIPVKTVVVAVEAASGRFDVWTPQGSPGRDVALPAHALTGERGNGFERLDYRSSHLELLMVRPGSGAWRLTTGDGTAADEGSASDGWVFTRPGSLSPIGNGEAAPESYEKGDLVFGISPVEMEYFAAKVVR